MGSQDPAESLPYLQGSPQGFQALADVCFVVEGHELPVHSQVLAHSCGFVADMLSLVGGAASSGRGDGGGDKASAPAFRSLLRLEEPFRGVKLGHLQLFLSCIYRPAEVPAMVAELRELAPVWAVYEVADKLDCSQLKTAMSERLASDAPEVVAMLTKDLLGWIEFASR